MIEWHAGGLPNGKSDTFGRNRNLFYVACSHPKKRLALLFTQKLSPAAVDMLEAWVGKNAVISLGADAA